MSYDVFISYSAKDKPTADAVVAGLENHRIRCWIAPRDIGAGKEYGAEIIAGITQSKVMVLIFSAQSNTSNQVIREVERAIHAQKTIIPFRIENANPTGSMEYFLSLPHWLDAYAGPISKHIDRLAETIAAILNGKASEEALPPPLPAKKRHALGVIPTIILTVAAVFVGLLFLAWQAIWIVSHPAARPAQPSAQASPVATPQQSPGAPAPTPSPAASPQISEATKQANLLVKQGMDFYSQEKYDDALDRHTQALALDPQNVDALLHRGNTYKAKQNIPAALEDYNAALKLRPNYAYIYYNRANAYVSQGDDVLALSDFSKAIVLDPKHYLALNNRGCLYKRQGAVDLAIADFTGALAIKPDYAKARNNLEAALRSKNGSPKPSPSTPAGKPASSSKASTRPAVLFDNGNINATLDTPTRATVFTISSPCKITAISDYHWNSGRGVEPGTIRLVQQGGKVFGPWKASGLHGQGGASNVTWIVKPDETLPPGTYTVIDSSPATWSQNPASQGCGFSKVEGIEIR